MDLFFYFKRQLQFSHLIENKDRIVVGISGGVDSMVLLDLLDRLRSQWDLKIFVAHLNYNLRGNDSRLDAIHVEKEARARKIPFYIHSLPAQFFNKTSNLQQEARDVRYRFFSEVAQKCKAQKIAIAHQADDQMETFFQRLLRGSGVEGLKGMAPARPDLYSKNIFIMRPLLAFSRSEVLKYAQGRTLHWREDVSNNKTAYLRNRIRHRLIEELKKIHPQVVQKMSESLQILYLEDAWIAEQVRERLKGKTRVRRDRISVPRALVESMPLPLRYRVYRELIGRSGAGLLSIQKKHLEAIDQMLTTQNLKAKVTLPRDYGVSLTSKSLLFQKLLRPQTMKKRGFFS